MIEKESNNHINNTINAVSGLVKEVPIYQDTIQPIAKEAGKALHTVGKVVNVALMPIRGLVWGFEQIEDFIQSKVEKKLEDVPIEEICTPDPSVAGPAIESLRYVGHNESLSELYANLIASAMDSKTAKTAHPSFVDIIKNMSSDEALVLDHLFKLQTIPVIDIKQVLTNGKGEKIVNELVSTIAIDAKCLHKDLTSFYITNLERLGLIEVEREGYLSQDNIYKRILNDKEVIKELKKINEESIEYKSDVKKYYLRVTIFGNQFCNACVISRDKI